MQHIEANACVSLCMDIVQLFSIYITDCLILTRRKEGSQ
jgi:hypothetical protein